MLLNGISFAERMASLYNSKKYADCTLLIENRSVPAHRIVLAVASSKLEKLLVGMDNINIVDLSFTYQVMEQILKHCYMQNIELQSLNHALDVIKAAQYFDLPDLIDLCCSGKIRLMFYYFLSIKMTRFIQHD